MQHWIDLSLLVTSGGVFIYLMIALLFPEKF